jgi:hypothetical protein
MMAKQKHKGGITFRESHGKLVKSTFPRCLRTYISVNDARCAVIATYPSFSRNTHFPLHEVHGAICSFHWLGIESLKYRTEHFSQATGTKERVQMKAAGGLTKGWSFLHCLRSSARRGLHIPDMLSKQGLVYANSGNRRRDNE